MNRGVAVALGLLIGSLAGACYAPSFADCALKCSTASTCPDGQSCDGTYCRDPNASGTCAAATIDAPVTIDGPANDLDNDTIPNANDNCPLKANLDQDNEDGDNFGDVCDPCPPVPGNGNGDDDGDGVGAACDPHPMVGGDSIAMFSGLNRPPTGALVTSSGNVSYAAGQLQINATASTPAHVVWPGVPGRNRTVTAQLTYDSLLAPPALIGVVDRFDASMNTGIACVAGLAPTNPPQLLLYDLPASERMNTTIAIGNGQMRTISLSRTANTYDCSIVSPLSRIVSTTPTNATMSVIHSGVRAHGAVSARVDWVLIVESP